jgi:hypothetical protein
MPATIRGALGVVVTIVVMAVLLRTVSASARRSGSRYVLEYGNPMRGLGVAMLVLGAFFLYAASRSSLDQRGIAWAVSSVLAAGGLYIFLEVFLVRIEFDESFIYSFSPWRGGRRIPWTDILSFTFSPLNRWYVIRTRGHATLRVSTFLSGVGRFLQRLRETVHA